MYLHHYIANREHGGHISMIEIPSDFSLLEAQEKICDRDPKLRQYDPLWLKAPRSSFNKQLQWSEEELQRQGIQCREETLPLLEQAVEDVYGAHADICLIFVPSMVEKGTNSCFIQRQQKLSLKQRVVTKPTLQKSAMKMLKPLKNDAMQNDNSKNSYAQTRQQNSLFSSIKSLLWSASTNSTKRNAYAPLPTSLSQSLPSRCTSPSRVRRRRIKKIEPNLNFNTDVLMSC